MSSSGFAETPALGAISAAPGRSPRDGGETGGSFASRSSAPEVDRRRGSLNPEDFLALAVAGASGDRAEADASRVFRADPGASLASVFAAFAARSCFPGDALPIGGAFALTMLVFGAKKLDIARMPCASLESRFGGAIANGDTAPGARHPRQPQRAFELKPRHRPAVFETP